MKKFHSLVENPTAGVQFRAKPADGSAQLHRKASIRTCPEPRPGAVMELAAASGSLSQEPGTTGQGMMPVLPQS